MWLAFVVTLVACLALPAGLATQAATAARPAARWVNVSVATLWTTPGAVRPVDTWATAVPTDPRRWVQAMTARQKLWLSGHLETQALYGTRVYVRRTSGLWSRVVVTGQPTPRDRSGYPGWMPTAQLTAAAPVTAAGVAVVTAPTAWLFADAALDRRLTEISFATRLPAASWTGSSVEVVLLNGAHAYVRRATVSVRAAGASAAPPTGTDLLHRARQFLGLPFLYGGTSGFGFDCSGFTHSVYKALGVTIPRDAAAQGARGRRVASRAALRPGDLLFFRNAAGSVHHVGMYAGNGRMIHSPHTGSTVRLVALDREPYRNEYAGARRYVTSP